MSDDRVGGGTKRDRIVISIVGLVAACVVAGAVTIPMYVLVAFVTGVGFLPPSGSTAEAFGTLPMMVLVGAGAGGSVGLIPGLLVGTPAHIALLRRRQDHCLHYAVAGAVAGLAGLLMYALLFGGPTALLLVMVAPPTFLAAAVAGACGGLIFWLIRRPDRDAKREGA